MDGNDGFGNWRNGWSPTDNRGELSAQKMTLGGGTSTPGEGVWWGG